MSSWVLAIDFGTSFTVAAVSMDDRDPEIVEIRGERRTPSIVLVLADGEIVVGRAAEDLAPSHPGNVLRALKTRIGDTVPVVVDGRAYQVVNLIALLLQEVVSQVTQQMGSSPREVRMTYPASWNKPRQQRLVEAAAKAGMDNIVLIPEPVAAAVAHAAGAVVEPGTFLAVYDLGGGTFDCAVVAVRDEVFEVVGRATGDQNIGGELFDELLMNFIGEKLEPAVWETMQTSQELVWMQVRVALRNEARKAKESLSSNQYADVIVPLPNGLLRVRLTRAEFEGIARVYLEETVSLLGRRIADAGLGPSDISRIALVGGASRSPLVEELITAAFPGVEISKRGDPKASVARGAARAARPAAFEATVAGGRITQPASPGTFPEGLRLGPQSEPPSPQPSPPSSRPRPAPPTAVATQRPATPASTGPPRRGPRRRTLVLAGAAVAVVAAGVGGVLGSVNSGSETAGTQQTVQKTVAAVAPTTAAAGSVSATDVGWRTVAPDPIARQQTASALNGGVWVVGGLLDATTATAAVEVYDPTINAWSAAPDLPVLLHHAMAVGYRGKLVVLGGWIPAGSVINGKVSDDVWELDASGWTSIGHLNHPRAAGSAVVIGGQIIVMGGQANGELVDSTEVFDGTTWRDVTPMPTPRDHLAAVSDGRYVYAVGGRELAAGKNLGTVERYDPGNDTWSPLPDLPTPRGGLGAVIVANKIFAIGGESVTGVFDNVEAFDLTKQTWSKSPPMTAGRHGMAVISTGNQICVIGGGTAGGHTSSTTLNETIVEN